MQLNNFHLTILFLPFLSKSNLAKNKNQHLFLFLQSKLNSSLSNFSTLIKV